MQTKTKAHLALLATNIFFAINFTAVKYLINQGLAKPFGLNLIRVAVTAALLWLIFLFKQQRTIIHKKDMARFFLCALSGIAINQLLFIKGLSLTYSIHASLLMLTTPILITFIASWFLKERLNSYKISGLILGITGAAILIAARDVTGNPTDVFWGDILVIINAVSYTIYFILVKPLMREYNPSTVIRMIFSIGFFIILPFCWKEFSEVPWHSYNLMNSFILGLVVFGGTFCAYLLNVYGIKILGASTAGTYIYSQPFFAAAIAMIFLGEQLSIYKIIAALFIFTGVYLATKITAHA
ncbi:MAG: DMT family transporter [Ferruginibacter sp.]|nr:DMT family transporter [Ferruginibacter sp.]